MTDRDLSVMFVINSLAPSGAEQSTVALLPYLQERGVRPEVLVLRDRPGLADQVEAAGIQLHQLDEGHGRIGWTRQLRRVLADRRPELVHTCLFEADVCGRVASASLRIPVVSTLPSELYGDAHLQDPSLNRNKVRASNVVDAATARLTPRLHAVSHQVAEAMAHRLRYPRDRIDVIFRGRPRTLAEATTASALGPDGEGALRSSLGVGDRQKLLLIVARHERPKGIDRALEAMPQVLAAHPDTVLLVAGRSGEQTAELEATIGRLALGDVVRFLGRRSDVDHLLRISDAFVLLSRREGLPGSLLEAMAAGTPAVVNRLPQILEVVGEQEAIVVAAEDPSVVADGINRALADPGAAARRADAAQRRFLEHFTLDRVADQTIDFYQRALG